METKENLKNTAKINWYPGHMAKTKRLIKEKLNIIDIVYEVIDSRVPLSSYIKDLDNLINNKPKILIFTKYDLCDKKVTDKFIDNYKDKGYHILKYDLNKTNSFNDLFELTNKILKEKLDKEKEKGRTNRNIRALIVGVPNAGKSTLINQIAKKKVASTGNKPGVTKNITWIRASKNIELLDTPGILWPNFNDKTVAYNLASTTAIKEEILPIEDVAYYIINFLQTYYENKLEEFYKIEKSNDIEEIFNMIAKRRGCLQKGGIPDYDKVVTIIINDIKSGKIKDITFDRLENE